MSKTVDQRVVEMQFDNKNFERNVSTTMSTLDKFKAKLNFTGAAKSFNEISSAASKVDISPIGKSIDTIQTKFSSMQVMGVTALANITNSAVNAAKNMAAAFTTAPIHSGFSEYELKMGSIQTIMAGTGESLETVNKYLNELNEYSDKTIYSFQDMTSNIGKFTNAGVKLEDAVAAIQGISNEAALSGANANEASRAMYNFAQALSSGYVKLIDWKSIELANMATQDFKNQLLETAVSLKTVTKTSDGMYKTLKGNVFNATKNFNDVLQDQWMTSDVLITTLKKYADTNTEIGKKATEAATRVKTFSQLMDTTKESLQSGWAQTFEIIIGDFDESTNLFTKISEKLGGVIGTVTDARNNMLKSALGVRSTDNWDTLIDRINAAGISTDRFTAQLRGVAKSSGFNNLDALIKEYGSLSEVIKAGKIPIKIITETLKKFTGAEEKAVETTKDVNAQLDHFKNLVTKVVRGDFGNGAARVKALTAAGEDYATVQAMVNQCWKDGKLDLSKLTVEQIENIGYTKEQAENIKQLAVEAEKTGKPIEELIKQLEKPSGKDLLFEAFANIGEQFKKIMQAFKDAWGNMFGDVDPAQSLYNAIEGFKEFTDTLEVTEEEAENFKNVFEGLFALFKFGHSVVSMSAKGALIILNEILKLFGTDILGVAGAIGEYIAKAYTWVDANTLVFDTWIKVGGILYTIIKGVYDCIKAFAGLEFVKDMVEIITNKLNEFLGGFDGFEGSALESLNDLLEALFDKIERGIKSIDYFWKLFKQVRDLGDLEAAGKLFRALTGTFTGAFTALQDFADLISVLPRYLEDAVDFGPIGTHIIEGLAQGLSNGIRTIADLVMELGKTIIGKFCDVLGIHSPSKVMFAIGGFIIAGLLAGLKDGETEIGQFIINFGKNFIDMFEQLDLGTILSIGIGIGLLKGVFGLIKVLDKLAAPVELLNSFSGAIKKVGEATKDYLQAKKLQAQAEAVKTFAVAIAILAGAMFLLSKLSAGQILGTGFAIAALGGILVALVKSLESLGPKATLELTGVALVILGLGSAILIIAKAMEKLAAIPNIWQAVGGLVAAISAIALLMGGLMFLMGNLAYEPNSIAQAALLIVAVSVSLLLIAKVLEQLSGLKWENMKEGLAGVACIEAIIIAMIAVSKLAGKHADNMGVMFLGISLALLIMVRVVKQLGEMEYGKLYQGLIGIKAFGKIIAMLMAVSLIAGKNSKGLALVLLSVSVALLIMVNVVKQLGELNQGQLDRGKKALWSFAAIISILIIVTKLCADSYNTKDIGLTLLGISVAILLMAQVIKKLGSLDIGQATKGVVAVGFLSAFIFGLIKALEKVDGAKMGKIGLTLMGLAAAIGIMAISVALLGLIDGKKLAKGVAAVGFLSAFVAGMTLATRGASECEKTVTKMAILIGVMAAALIALSFVDAAKLWSSVGAMSAIMLMFAVMSKSIKGLTVSKGMIGGLAVMIVAIGLIGLVLFALGQLEMESSLNVALALSVLIVALSASCVLLSKAGILWGSALAGIGVLAALIVALGIIFVALGALVTYFPKLEEFLDKGLPVLEKLGLGLGNFFGSIVKGFAEKSAEALPKIAECLSQFMEKASGFITGAGLVDGSVLKGAAILAASLLLFVATDFIAGLTTFGPLSSSFADMGRALASFMFGALPFITGIKMVDVSMLENVKALAEMILILTAAEFLQGITNFGFGSSSIADFGKQLIPFGICMVAFSKIVSGNINETAVTAAANAGKVMASLANEIPNTGGVLGFIMGNNDLDTFGQQLVSFGMYMVMFSNIVSTGTINETAITAAANAGMIMTALAKEIPNTGGVLAFFTGDNSLDDFGINLIRFGNAIVAFSSIVKDNIDMAAVEAAKNAGLLMTELANAIPKTGGIKSWFTGDNDMESFGDNLEGFGKSLKKFAKKVEDINIDKFPSIVENLKALLNLKGSLAEFDTKMGEKGGEGVKAFADALGDAENTIASAGKKIPGKVIKGVKTKETDIVKCGEYFVKGFAKGISDSTYLAEARAKAMARKAADAAKEELDERSPSRVGHGIGSFFGIGFANGIASTVKRAYDASTEMATSAKNGLTKVVSRVADIISTDIDTQPTIRPVLDLSDVSANAGKIDRMLNVNPSLGVLANVSAINSMMSGNQNGGNDDVVSAIKDLKGALGDIPGTTYMVNGVTYDDGTNVANAVGDLVRYARIERRA